MSNEEIQKDIREMHSLFRNARRKSPRQFELDPSFLRPREVEELRSMVESGATEREIDSLIKGEPNLLSALLYFASTGHHGGMVYPQQVIRPTVLDIQKGLIPDYLIRGDCSDGPSWWVLELKGPNEKIFTGSNGSLKLSDVANKGFMQINRYIDFCTEHQSTMREALKLDVFSQPMGILLIGRAKELEDEDRRKMKRKLGGPGASIRIRTWDSLLQSLDHKLAVFKHTDKDPHQEGPFEDWHEDVE